MARNFNGSGQFLKTLTAPVTTYPFTIAGWFKSTDLANLQVIVQLSDDSLNNQWRVMARGDIGGDPLEFT